MQRKYYGSGLAAPDAGVPMHAQKNSRRQGAPERGEIITPQPVRQERPQPAKGAGLGALADGFFKDGKLLGRFETDDIILLCLIFLVLQNDDDPDWPLLLALGYIFLSDKDFKLF